MSERTDSQSLGPSETLRHRRRVRQRRLPAERRRLPLPLPRRPPLLRRHVGHLARLQHAPGRAVVDRRAAAAPARARRPADVGRGHADALVGRPSIAGHRRRSRRGRRSTLVERQLPPQVRHAATTPSVWDWRREGGVASSASPRPATSGRATRRPTPGEPPRSSSIPAPGASRTRSCGPHLGKRPPFAPNHGPAPFLDPIRTGHDPPAPGANGPASLCPAGHPARDTLPSTPSACR